MKRQCTFFFLLPIELEIEFLTISSDFRAITVPHHHVLMRHVPLGPQWPNLMGTSKLPRALRRWRTVGAIVSPAAWPTSSLLLLLQEKGRVLVITTSFLIWGPWLHVFQLLPGLLIGFPICLLRLELLRVRDGKDNRETKRLLLFCVKSRHSKWGN